MHLAEAMRHPKLSPLFSLNPIYFRFAAKTIQKNDTNCIAPRKKEKNVLSIEQVDKSYDDSDKTNRIEIENRFVDFTKHFKYVGSLISYHIRHE